MAFHPLSLLLLIISLPLLLLLLFQKHRQRKRKILPPGPKKLPIIGNLHLLGPLPHRSLHKLSTKYGPLMSLQLGSIPTLVISSANMAEEVFKSHDLTFSGRPEPYAVKRLFYGHVNMAFTPYGECWRQMRKISTTEILSIKRVESFRVVREEEVASMISSIKSFSSFSSDPINMSEMMFCLTSNISSRIVLGTKFGGGDYNLPGGSRFRQIVAETHELLGGFCVADFIPWFGWIHAFTGIPARLDKISRVFDELFDRVIEEHLNTPCPETGHEDFVHVLLRLQKDPAYGITLSSMNQIKATLLDTFIAATDSTSAVLVWTMTELVRNPRVMNNLKQEVRNAVGNKGRVEECDLQQLNYLKLVVKEALRVHPPGPLLVPRETTETCTIKGYEIPAKTRVLINAKAILMDPDYWENPEEFRPERFLDEAVDFRGQNFRFLPFGAGRRMCPAINFATALLEFTLANLIYCFEWELPFGVEPMDLDVEEVFQLILQKKNPLCLVAKPNKC